MASQPFPLLAAPARPPLRIDAHCHLFNGHDLPIYGLLKSVFLEQNVFGLFAIPFALWLAASVEGNSPTYKQENDDLDHLIGNPAAIAKQQTPDQVVEYLERGMIKFIEEQTSFGHPKSPATDHNDAFLLELARRFAPTSTLQERLTKDDLLKLRDDQQYRRELIKRILEYKSQKDTLGFFDDSASMSPSFAAGSALPPRTIRSSQTISLKNSAKTVPMSCAS